MRLNINHTFKIFLFGIFLMTMPNLSKASHIIGGDILYKCLGSNQYEVTVNIYRDCFFGRNDAPFDDPASIGVFDAVSHDLLIDLRIPFTGDDTLNSLLADPCFVVPPTVCVHTSTYRDTVELLPRANGYRLVYQRCCRNQTVNNIILPDRTGATYEIIVSEKALNECNASPVFKEWPPIFICAGTEIDYDHGATDVEGDSLVYSLCTPNTGASFGFPKPQPPNNPPYDTVVWRAPYDLNNILGSGNPLRIDSETGRLTGRPDDQGQFVVGICIEEWRDDVLLSRTIRDFQYNVGQCGMITSAFNSPDVQCDNLEVVFDNQSTFSDRFEWIFDFPAGNLRSTEVSPTFTYPDTGHYTIALIAQPNSSCVDTSFSTIFLQNNSLDADFEMVVFDCVDSSSVVVNDFTVDLVSPPVSWMWEFEFSDGTIRTSTDRNPIFVAPNLDTVQVRLKVESENGCISELTKEIPTQTLDPGATIPATLSICMGESVELNPGGLTNFNYFWSPATGLSDRNAVNPTATPSSTTTYTVEIFGNNRLCTKDQDIEIIVQPQPNLAFDWELGCDNRTITFTNNSVSTVNNYIWNFGDPAGTTSTEANPTFTYPDVGNYNVTLTLDPSASLCMADVTETIEINNRGLSADFDLEYTNCDPGNVEITFTSTSQNSGHNITAYNWNFGGSLGTGSGPVQSITLGSSQTITVELEIVTAQGCTERISRDLDINLVEVLPNGSFQTCSSDSLSLNPGFNPNYIYEWSPAIGFSPNDPNPRVKLDASQNYTVRIQAIGADTCEVLHQVIVTVPQPINLQASDDELTCDSTVTLFANASSTAMVTWYDVNNVSVANGSTLMVNVSGQTSYTVIAEDNFGCSEVKTIQVAGGPVDVAYPDDQTICTDEAYTVQINNLDPNDNLSYAWSADPVSRILGGANTANPDIDDSPGRFTLYTDVVSQFGCRYSDTLEMVLVDPAPMDFDFEVQCDGLTVEFENLTPNGFDYEWEFGDLANPNSTSNVTDPSYTYSQLGGYWVLLSITPDVACRDSVLKFVSVSDVILEADFDVSYLNCSEDSITVQFTDQSFSLQNNLDLFEWDFGPLGTTNDPNPSFTFDANTTVTATLSISNTADCDDEKTETIELELFNTGLPTNASVQCENLDLFLNPNGNPDYIYEWAPANRVDDPNAVNPRFTGTENTVFDVTIRNIGVDTCEIVRQVEVEVPQPIQIDMPADTQSCGAAILLQPTINVPVSYVWVNSAGDTLNRGASITVNPNDSDYYVVTGEDAFGCSLSDTINVTNRQADIDTDGSGGVCQNDPQAASVINLDADDDLTSIMWIPDSKIISGQGTETVQISTNDPGLNIIQVSVENQFGCRDTQSVVIAVGEFQRGADASLEICAEVETNIYPGFIPGYQYQWSPATGLDDPMSSNPLADLTDDITYTAVVTQTVDSLICMDTVTVDVMVQEPIMLELTPDDTLCAEQSIDLEVLAPTQGLDFEWSDSPTFDDVLGTDRVLTVSRGGVNTFYVQGSTQDNLACEYFGSVTISIVPIDVTPDADNVACYQEDATISVTNNDASQVLTYNWRPIDQIVSGGNTPNPTVNLETATTFMVDVESQYGCTETIDVPVDVPVFGGNVTATATPDSIIQGQTSQLEATFFDDVDYSWDPSGSLDDDMVRDPIASPDETTEYTVTVSDDNGCVEERTVTVVVFDPLCVEPYIFLPNAFSPDGRGAGKNEVLKVLGQHIEEMHLIIFDRWGQKVFESRDRSFGWDGTFKGKELSPDVYGFYLTVRCIDGEEFAKKGNVTLFR